MTFLSTVIFSALAVFSAQAKPIPIHISPSGFLYLPCSINGFKGSCLLDTGATSSQMLKRVAKGWPTGFYLGVGLLGGFPGFQFNYAVKDHTLLDQPVPIKDMTASKGFSFPEQPEDLVGFSGGDTLKGKILHVDTARCSAQFLQAAKGKCVSFKLAAGSPYLELEHVSGGKLYAIIDTAAGTSVLFPQRTTLARLEQNQGKMGDASGKEARVRFGKLEVVILGKKEVLRVVIPNTMPSLSKLKENPIDMVLGLDYLSNKRFVLDYRDQNFCVEN